MVLPLHCFVAGSVAALAASLGDSVEYTGERVPDPVRWLMCGSLARKATAECLVWLRVPAAWWALLVERRRRREAAAGVREEASGAGVRQE